MRLYLFEALGDDSMVVLAKDENEARQVLIDEGHLPFLELNPTITYLTKADHPKLVIRWE